MSHPPYQPPPTRPMPPAYGYGPAPQPPKKSRAWVWILSGALVMIGLCGVAGAISNLSGDTDASSNAAVDQAQADSKAPAKAPTKPKAKAAGIGQGVRDGKFEFTVHDVDCGKTEVGSEYFSEKAQGKFCLIQVTVVNIGDVPQMFHGGSQKAYDAGGAKYGNDGAAELYANDGNTTFLEEINPGNKVSGNLIFDVPDKVVLTTVELHDSPFSRGVKVSLAKR